MIKMRNDSESSSTRDLEGDIIQVLSCERKVLRGKAAKLSQMTFIDPVFCYWVHMQSKIARDISLHDTNLTGVELKNTAWAQKVTGQNCEGKVLQGY